MSTIAIGSMSLESARRKLQSFADRALARLRAQEVINSLGIVLAVSLCLLMILIAADRYLSLMRLGVNIWIIWAGITALGIPYVLWRAYSPRIHTQLAAVLADDRLKLHARLCSALTLDLSDPATAQFSEAFFQEALVKVEGIDVEHAFPVRVPRGYAFLVVPAGIAAGLYAFMPYQDVLGLVAERDNKHRAEETNRRSAEAIERKLEDLRAKKPDEKGDENAGNFKVNQLVQQAEALAGELKEGKRDKDEALLAMGQIKRQIEEEKEKLRDGKEFLDRLQQLKAKDLNLEESDLTKDVSEALKQGDAALAAQQMRRLAQKIKQDILDNPNKSEQEKKQEMEKLQREVERLAGALAEEEKLKEGLKDLSKDMMAPEDFKKLQDEIAKQEQKNGKPGKPGKNQGDDIQQRMEEVAEEMEKEQEENDANLSEEEQQEDKKLDQLDEGLDEAMENMADEGAGKPQAGEQGKPAENGKQGKQPGKKGGRKPGGKQPGKSMRAKPGGSKPGDEPGNEGQGKGQGKGENEKNGKKNGKPGDGLGGGPGQGHRPYRDGDAQFQSQKVKGELQNGAITGLSHFRGQGAKGEVPMEFKKTVQDSAQSESSSLELERIPNDARDVVKDYFSRVKSGAGLEPAPAPQPTPPAPPSAAAPATPKEKPVETLKE